MIVNLAISRVKINGGINGGIVAVPGGNAHVEDGAGIRKSLIGHKHNIGPVIESTPPFPQTGMPRVAEGETCGEGKREMVPGWRGRRTSPLRGCGPTRPSSHHER